MPSRIEQVTENDLKLMEDLMGVFGTAFQLEEVYTKHRPGAAYLRSLLASDYFITLVAIDGEEVVGGG